MAAVFVQRTNHRVRERFPAQASVRMRLMRAHRQNRVQQQNALLRPIRQAAVRRHLKTVNIVRQLFVYIRQRRRNIAAFLHRKRQTVRLMFVVIRVLPQNHHLHLVPRRVTKCIKHLLFGRIHRLPCRAFRPHLLQHGLEIRLLLFLPQYVCPCVHHVLLLFGH